MYRQKNTDKHLAYPCFLLPLPRSTAAQKNVHFVLKIGTFRFADYTEYSSVKFRNHQIDKLANRQIR